CEQRRKRPHDVLSHGVDLVLLRRLPGKSQCGFAGTKNKPRHVYAGVYFLVAALQNEGELHSAGRVTD
ncbi:hypothetical protein ACFL5X_01845, partial [Candidatus Omnitrophota bacterium]